MTVYFDYAATTPVLPEIAEIVTELMCEEFGNAGSRTHVFGNTAKKVVAKARSQIGEVINCEPDEVIFTSGATESNNLALLGLKEYLINSDKQHVISMQTEHKAVLEPLMELQKSGISVSLLKPLPNGVIDLNELTEIANEKTGLISIMHVNNETGVIQPIEQICELLSDSTAILHVDAAQSFGKVSDDLKNKRIDLISVSGHKIYAPKGVGALVSRKRDYVKLPLKPISFGGGQEQGLRPGTLPVSLIAGLGLAAELSIREETSRATKINQVVENFETAATQAGCSINGDEAALSPYIRNIVLPGIDAEAAMVLIKDYVAVSNGSACTSAKYTSSHVLTAMGLSEQRIQNSIRFSFSHLIDEFDWKKLFDFLSGLRVS